MLSLNMRFEGGFDDIVDVLRDELTGVQELKALKEDAVEHSGTWDPEGIRNASTHEELMEDFFAELVETHGTDAERAELAAEQAKAEASENASSEAPAPGDSDLPCPVGAPVAYAPKTPEVEKVEVSEEEFDTSHMDRREKAIFKKYQAAKPQAGVARDPPPIHDTRRMVREDTPWYIAAAFLKSFQTGAGDFWAFKKAREARKLPVSLHSWLFHVLRRRDGRALRHPRFFYFAVNTLLRNKAVRSKSYFVKRAFGEQAFTEHTPRQLLDMGKAQMANVLCAYETDMPGSAAEKLRQRADLEAMLHQLEEESLQRASRDLPETHEALTTAVARAQVWLGEWARLEEAAADEVAAKALAEAEREQGRWKSAGGERTEGGAPASKRITRKRMRGKQGPALPRSADAAPLEAAPLEAGPAAPARDNAPRASGFDDPDFEDWDVDFGEEGEEPGAAAPGPENAPDGTARPLSAPSPPAPRAAPDSIPSAPSRPAPVPSAARSREELLRERRQVLLDLRAAVEEHACHRREVEQ